MFCEALVVPCGNTEKYVYLNILTLRQQLIILRLHCQLDLF